jgi:ribose 5-phosphate isomerase
VNKPAQLARRLDAVPGVIEHGLFGPELDEGLVAQDGEIKRLPWGEHREDAA